MRSQRYHHDASRWLALASAGASSPARQRRLAAQRLRRPRAGQPGDPRLGAAERALRGRRLAGGGRSRASSTGPRAAAVVEPPAASAARRLAQPRAARAHPVAGAAGTRRNAPGADASAGGSRAYTAASDRPRGRCKPAARSRWGCPAPTFCTCCWRWPRSPVTALLTRRLARQPGDRHGMPAKGMRRRTRVIN